MKAKVKGKKVELTDWYPPHIKPVHVGWYHTCKANQQPINYLSESDYNWWWNGDFWSVGEWLGPVDSQDRYWRGLAQPWSKS